MLKKVRFLLILLILLASPVPYASVPKYALFFLELSSLILLILFIAEKDKEEDKFPSLFPFLSILFLFFLLFQIVPLPLSLVKILSPGRMEFCNLFSKIEEFKSETLTIRISPELTKDRILEYFSYFLIGFIAFRTFKTKKEIEWVLIIIIFSGVSQAFLGLLQAFSGSPKILFLKKKYVYDIVSGTFVNRNHLAGFLEMIVPVSIGYLILSSFYPPGIRGGAWEKILYFVEERIQKLLLYLLFITIMMMGIIFSRSRSGIIASLVSIFLIILFFLPARSKKFGRKVISFLLIALIFSSIIIGIKPIIERFAPEKMLSEMRPVIWKGAWEAFKNFSIVGTGAGTFKYIYPLYAKHSITAIVEHAHNDYLEFLVELGIFGSLILFLLIIGLWVYLLIKWIRRKNIFVKGAGLGILVAILSIFFHSFTDFNLHIPSNIVYFTVLFVIGIRIMNLEEKSL